jgi:hypothetical protein
LRVLDACYATEREHVNICTSAKAAAAERGEGGIPISANSSYQFQIQMPKNKAPQTGRSIF